MIVGEQKPLAEIKEMLHGYNKVLVLGCGTCVTVCFAGGTKEVGILASSLRMASKLDGAAKEAVDEETVQRQCEWEYIDPLASRLEDYDAVLSLACGIGVQAMSERFPKARVLPGLNTTFLGLPSEQGIWEERCQACGQCVLHLTAGICPVSRCSKQLMNGPCGGSQNGVCEIDPDVPCAWQLIYDRMAAFGTLDLLMEVMPPKDWSVSRDGGPRRIIREDLQLPEDHQEN
jgi:ferredoxin